MGFFKKTGIDLAYYNTETGGIYDRKTKKVRNARCLYVHQKNQGFYTH